MNLQDLLEPVIDISCAAGAAILKVYERDDFGTRVKSDDSPLTEADLASHHIIEKQLNELTPDIPVLSEESKNISYEERKEWSTYWLVDPLDGTKEFISRNNDFTTNIALIHNGRPILGVIYVPVDGVLYYAADSLGAFKRAVGTDIGKQPEPIKVRDVPNINGEKHYTVVASRRHGLSQVETLCDKMHHYELINRGSSLKMCQVAEGVADLYPRLAPTSEWDTAAAQIIVEEAGGQLVGLDFQPVRYNAKESLLNDHFYVLGSPHESWQSLLTE